jgi:LPS O-antigen subunit length determinant protein (WzzB/FepE family)
MQKDYVNTSDSIKDAPEKMENALKLKQLQNRMEDFGKIADEFKLASQSLPAVLYVIEPASPAPYAERPDKKAVIIIAALAGLIFGCMVVLVNDRKTTA